jgi:glycerophosphoryl diester phosphodiesterase
LTLQNTAYKGSADRLVAHRGLQAAYPENTALSVRKAIEAGALFVEIDIQLSLDQQPMVYHDISLKRVSGQDGMISSLNCSDLMALPAYEPERLGEQFISETISPLAKVVDIILSHPQITLFVELKEESIAEFGADIMLGNVCQVLQPIRDRAVLISFDYRIIASAKTKGWPQVGAVLQEWDHIDSEAVKAIDGDYTFVDHKIIPETENLDRLASKLVAYEVGSTALATELANRGVAMFETFDIATLIE